MGKMDEALMDIPLGWNKIAKEFYDNLQELNQKFSENVMILQIKTKFGFAVIYTTLPDDGKYNDTYGALRKEYEDKLDNVCFLCGKQLEKVVIDSKITLQCFDHWKQNKRYSKRIL